MATPLLDIDTQHKEMIHDAQLDYYAKRLATCSSDTTIKVYDILGDQQYQFLTELKGHDGPVWQVAWAHPKFGVVLASCSFDGKVIIHREQPGGQWQKIFVYQEIESSVNSISWAPHEFDLCLACVSSDGKLAILSHNANDMWSATVVEAPNGLGLNAVSWAPYGSSSQSKERRVVTGGCDNSVRIWVSEDGKDWKSEQTLSQHNDWVRDVAWAPSIGLPCNTIASCSEDGRVVVWTQKDHGTNWESTIVHEKKGTPVWRVSWSITGSVLAISAGDSEVTLWKESPDGKSWVQISNVNEAITQQPVPPQHHQDTMQHQDMMQQPHQDNGYGRPQDSQQYAPQGNYGQYQQPMQQQPQSMQPPMPGYQQQPQMGQQMPQGQYQQFNQGPPVPQNNYPPMYQQGQQMQQNMYQQGQPPPSMY